MDRTPAPTPRAETTSEPSDTGLSHREVVLCLFALLLGLFVAAIDQTMVSVALPVIVGDLGGLEQLSWVVAAYLVTSTVSMPLYGKISDVYGRRVVFQTALGIYLVTSMFCGLAQDINQLIVFRALQGIGGGGLMTLAFTILGDILSPRERGRYMGYFAGTWAVAGVAGPFIGGLLTDAGSWRLIFFVKLPVGVFAMAVIHRVLRLPIPQTRHRIDFEGAALLVGAITSVMLVAVWGGTTFPWTSPLILGLIGAALLLGSVFLWWEARVPEPILPLGLFRNSIVTVCVVVGFLIGVAMFGAFVFLPLLLQAVVGLSATASGMFMVPMMAGVTTASIVAGRLVSRTGRYKVWPVIGMGLVVGAMAILALVGAGSGLAGVVPPILLLGLGMGMVMPVLNVAVQNAVEHKDLGVATSTVTFVRTMGGALGVAVFGAILTARLHVELVRLMPADAGDVDLAVVANRPDEIRNLPGPVADAVIEALSRSIGTVFLVAAPIALIGWAIVWFLREIPLRETVGGGPGAGRPPGPPGPSRIEMPEPAPETSPEVAQQGAAGRFPAPSGPASGGT